MQHCPISRFFAAAVICCTVSYSGVVDATSTLHTTHKRSSSATPPPASTPVPIRIANTRLYIGDSIWTVIVGVGTLALAGATFVLALYTRALAKETKESLAVNRSALASEEATRRQENVRHQDSFMPHLALIASNRAVDMELAGGGLSRQIHARQLHVRNIGVGPALAATGRQKSTGSDCHFENIPTAFAIRESFLAVRGGTASQIIELELEYEDVFGRRFRSAFCGDFSLDIPYTWERLWL
jgi:hypothetical protein